MEMLRLRHSQTQKVPEGGTRLTGQTMKSMVVWKNGILLALGRKWSMQGMHIVKRWRDCSKTLSDNFLAKISHTYLINTADEGYH